MLEDIYYHINNIAIYSILLSMVLAWKERNIIKGAPIVMMFLACIFLYLVIGYVPPGIFRKLLLSGPFLIPFMFWQFSLVLFTDSPYPTKKLLAFMLVTIMVYYALYFLFEATSFPFLAIALRTFSVFFVILAVIASQSGKSTDLDKDRLLLRKYFVYIISAIVIITLLIELGIDESKYRIPGVLQRGAIVFVNSLFIYLSFNMKLNLLSKRKPKTNILNPKLIEKIQSTIFDQQLYKKERLTIGQLAEEIGEQEYKVRRTINQELGYRNFLDFINSFRIKEATRILKDSNQSEKTILEIAYECGFNSIGPFNRTFKAITGQTPTEYRKQAQES